jgi:murein DD-endopeptidase MepM/ murein hydrolase activator NlpD
MSGGVVRALVTACGAIRRDGMRNRHWTVVLVGDDTDSPRTMRFSSRTVRVMGWLAGTVVVGLVVASIGVGVTYGKRRASSRDPVEFLRDSIASLDRQTTTLRVVAGLDTTMQPIDSAPPAPASVDLLLHRADQLSVNLEQVADKLHNDADKVARTPSIMPTAGWLTSQFSLSRFHPILHKWLPHLGIDVAAPYGTTVVAPAAGTVVRAGVASGYGMVLEIDHGNGIVTKYGHLSRFLVRERQQVTRGQPIAEVGNSGLATGPHLHYEVHVGGTIVDPLTYVLPSTIPDPVRQTDHAGAVPED